jgi:ATP-dependent 26S proteasome regulatory subunit
VIAATNMKTQLDSALFRRFDAVLTYELPGEASVRPLIAQRLNLFDTESLDWRSFAVEAAGLSHAEIVRAAEEAARDAVMAERYEIETSDLVGALRKRNTR